ncbi:hypothetical protein LOZ53_006765 [Ophidiomyces ophidiicola]|uniref:Uncharacterized protein n=1 Tax=Ophidiomyces ophidiicola TaxID=1387563 RepID=A0ACB8UU37_9EURO|nr:uncharacterized protein LOZ57_001218 [Ophidiomyces ophidiicola]KAI1905725.1 hypothetical protein LOZ64_006681 [Ophidiomyces ophidiicola]KAI1907680.1 hypothetical protein LOZ61_006012 [Ophidiomyces ophidiicola]KAI1925285.1 hypothetical protein LOZ60_004226 [Ophidiomyces ophidiicola]KAI1937429.1 hypothetical protein LOZ62_005449 [Ophidiomyces ophidiicola]KAI1951806.1 hypothetical protein LOZ57_001218 [Ophidiomyces ophidiicola]
MSSPPTSKRIKTTVPANPPPTQHALNPAAAPFPGPNQFDAPPMVPPPQPTAATAVTPQHQPGNVPVANPRKRRASFQQNAHMSDIASPQLTAPAEGEGNSTGAAATPDVAGKKKGRTNTPWTAEEEQRLKAMRDSGNTWSEIAKTFPARTEGSVKKHWYKDMHYAEFGEEDSIALRDAIKEYEANKWKVIGQKIGKPAKACEQYAKDHFRNL